MTGALTAIGQSSMSLEQCRGWAEIFTQSKLFGDITSAAQAVVKIAAGSELGLPPYASMNGIHIIQGKTTLSATTMAMLVKRTGTCDFRVVQHDNTICSIDAYEHGQKVGNSTFTFEEGRKAGTKNLDKFPKNMLYARAMSNLVRWYFPHVFGGPIYTPEEMGAQVNEEGEVIAAFEPMPIAAIPASAPPLTMVRGKVDDTIDDPAPAMKAFCAFARDTYGYAGKVGQYKALASILLARTPETWTVQDWTEALNCTEEAWVLALKAVGHTVPAATEPEPTPAVELYAPPAEPEAVPPAPSTEKKQVVDAILATGKKFAEAEVSDILSLSKKDTAYFFTDGTLMLNMMHISELKTLMQRAEAWKRGEIVDGPTIFDIEPDPVNTTVGALTR